MEPSPTHYVDCDGRALAYQVVGDGHANLVLAYELMMHLDLAWTDPDIHRNYERGSQFARMAVLQPRGFGLSEQVNYTPTVEQQADDIIAVMDACGMRRATLVGFLNTCNALAVVAARIPSRVNGLVLLMPVPYGSGALTDCHGWTELEISDHLDRWRDSIHGWGSGLSFEPWDAALSTPFNRRLLALCERNSATPIAAKNYFDAAIESDFRDVYRLVRVPARVLWLGSCPVPQAFGEYVASLIPEATFHRLPETPPGSSVGQSFVPTWDHIEEMTTGSRHSADSDKFLGTVLFTDVVSSTELLAQVGDAEYQRLREAHERLVRLAVSDAGGELVSVMGDGTLSVFDGPTAAVRCAQVICSTASDNGLAVRAGAHSGELHRDGMNVTGIAVHIGARVSSLAGPGEVWVSRTVRDLVVGSGLGFVAQGPRQLKGVPETWELFKLAHAGEQAGSVPIEDSIQTTADKLALRVARRAPALSRATMRVANVVQRRRARVTDSSA
jgi:class 3 adenylate cyclase/pimeloyl-ACP methyl ester carboxylesterase